MPIGLSVIIFWSVVKLDLKQWTIFDWYLLFMELISCLKWLFSTWEPFKIIFSEIKKFLFCPLGESKIISLILWFNCLWALSMDFLIESTKLSKSKIVFPLKPRF